jgi:peptide methionine sulfoxide reductase MsrA
VANPQPDIHVRISKELWRAIIKWKFPPRSRQIFDAIIYLTYAQIPPVKEAQISGGKLMELTGLNKNQTSKGFVQLLNSNLVAKNGDYRPPIIGINKNYESWKESPKMATTPKIKGLQPSKKKESPKMATRVAKNGDSSKVVPIIYNKKEILAIDLYEFYKNEINPQKKVRKGAIKNILFYLKKYSLDELKKSIENYKIEALENTPKFRKSCSNFFGRNGESECYFEDYLSSNFKDTKDTDDDEWRFQ